MRNNAEALDLPLHLAACCRFKIDRLTLVEAEVVPVHKRHHPRAVHAAQAVGKTVDGGVELVVTSDRAKPQNVFALMGFSRSWKEPRPSAQSFA